MDLKKIALLLCLSFCANAEMPLNQRFALTDVRIIDDVNGVSIILPVDHLFYSAINPIIRGDYFPIMNQVVNEINLYPQVTVSVTGHTDQAMTREQRLEMSEKYAHEVAQYLLTRGVDPNRIIMVRGEAAYLPDDTLWTRNGRYMNRRVEVTLHGHPETWVQSCGHCMGLPEPVGTIE